MSDDRTLEKEFGLYDRAARKKALDDVSRYKWTLSPEKVEAVWEAFVAAIPHGCRVLDVGCGGGHVAKLIEETRPDLVYMGFDLIEKNINDRLLTDPHLNIWAGNFWVELTQEIKWDFVMSVGALFSSTEAQHTKLLCQVLNAAAPKGFIFIALGGSWGIDKEGTDYLKALVAETSVGLKECYCGGKGPFIGTEIARMMNKGFFVLRDGVNAPPVTKIPQNLLDFPVVRDPGGVDHYPTKPLLGWRLSLAAIKEFQPVTPACVKTFEPYYQAFFQTRHWPRFYQAPLWLQTKSEFSWGVIEECLCILKRKVIHTSTTMQLILPPMHISGNVLTEQRVLEAFLNAGFSAKLSEEDLIIYRMVADGNGAPEFIYRAGDFDDLSGGHNKHHRRQRRELDQDLVLIEEAEPELCRQVDLVWGRLSGKPTKHSAAMVALHKKHPTCLGHVTTTKEGEPLCYGLSQQVRPGRVVVLIGHHTYSSKVFDAGRALHLRDCDQWRAKTGPDTLMNTGSAVGIPGLSAAKEKMRPVKMLQIYDIKPSQPLGRDAYHATKQDPTKKGPPHESTPRGFFELPTRRLERPGLG